MKHIFLTGDTQVGKSTIIRRFLEAHPEFKVGGFRTVAGPALSADSPGDGIYMMPADRDVPLTVGNLLFERPRRRENQSFRVFPEVFDTLGVSLLREADDCDLILMDEIGLKEQDSPLFQRAVLERLNGDIPVIGVVQKWDGEFVNTVRAHSRVELITVTPENREDILQEILKREWT